MATTERDEITSELPQIYLGLTPHLPHANLAFTSRRPQICLKFASRATSNLEFIRTQVYLRRNTWGAASSPSALRTPPSSSVGIATASRPSALTQGGGKTVAAPKL